MRPLARVGLVAGGYAAAFAIAQLAVTLRIAATSGPDRQDYGAMYAFGDPLLFLAVFGLAGCFLLSALIAPGRPARIALLAATTIETAGFATVALAWLLHSRP
jgi:hypothetical protein